MKRRDCVMAIMAVAVSLILCFSLFTDTYITSKIHPEELIGEEITDVSNLNQKLIWSGIRPYIGTPSKIYLLSNGTEDFKDNCQKFLFLYNSKVAPPPGQVAKNLRVRAESNITIVRFEQRNIKVTRSTQLNSLYIELLFNINGAYNCSFTWKRLPFISFPLLIENITHFLDDQSFMQCYGGNYNNRWCEVWNVCWKWKRFQFYSDTSTAFKVRIAYPGSRPVPHDYLSCRIIFRMIAHRWKRMSDFKSETVRIYDELSFLTCRWFGMQHFFHVLFDYTVPLWWTMQIHGGVNRSNRIFTLDDNKSEKGYLFLESLSDHKVENIRKMPRDNLSCWRHAIIGTPKAENPVCPEKWPDSYDLPYDYPHSSVLGNPMSMREHFLSYYNGNESLDSINSRCQPDPKHPKVLLTFRKEPKRHIVNKEELTDSIKKWCPECRVTTNFARAEGLKEQLNDDCDVSILIGIHGGGLSHMAFMKPSTREAPTAAIEILPYRYTCRSWYRSVAITSGVRYFRWANTNFSNSDPAVAGRDNPCFKGIGECLSEACHEKLRDQRTTVDPASFKETFMAALDYVQGRTDFDAVDLANQNDNTSTVTPIHFD